MIISDVRFQAVLKQQGGKGAMMFLMSENKTQTLNCLSTCGSLFLPGFYTKV